ncbi:DNA-processing protein DprA [Mycoplasma procyoni]|uniref:DNA-processing protein DprA n=1 Tax=Mycoplasma procyoni TaxID=568784 RepID=UPI00197B3512|nr:DNA-processing protein DprA [Mycoplasma procyoni]MBN3534784.1 DNA-protecting protein DprA [Mycoplasma procyoni]
MDSILIYLAIKYQGKYSDIYKALKDQEKIPVKEVEKIDRMIASGEIKAITIIDEKYPQEFKYLFQPPFVIFYEGNKELLKNPYKLCLTGDSETPKVNRYLDQSLPEVIKRQTLVTSYFKNVEEKVVDYFEKNDAPRIFISANGLNNPYFAKKVMPGENTLIISEYPNGVHLSKNKLKNRNRLVASLAQALVIYSSGVKSGIMNLVTNFLNMGKDIFCYPGNFDENDGNSKLLKEGANLITSIKDVYETGGV